jgi:hypothetical protein
MDSHVMIRNVAHKARLRLMITIIVPAMLFSILVGCSDDTSSLVAPTQTQVPEGVVVVPACAVIMPTNQSEQLVATAFDGANGKISDQAFTWSSSDNNIATVTSSGLVTAVAPGNVTITATAGDMSGSSCISIGDYPLNSGSYAVDNWSNTGISGGTTAMSIERESACETIEVCEIATATNIEYKVSLSGGGVSFRTVQYRVQVPTSGTVTFDWEYTGHHRWYLPVAYLRFIGKSATTVVNDSTYRGFAFSGTISIEVESGGEFIVELGGSNYDSTSVIEGNVRLTNFRTP